MDMKERRIFRVMDEEVLKTTEEDKRMRAYLTPKKIVWMSEGEMGYIQNAEVLLEDRKPQISLAPSRPCIFTNRGETASVLLDFGLEIQGGIELFTWLVQPEGKKEAKLRIRFGESAMEAMSEIGGEENATNDHAFRDLTVRAGFMNMLPVGDTGFRFVRIDLITPGTDLIVKTVKAVLKYRDIAYRGRFSCSDPLLNRIWDTAVYTVHLNMQNYIWDGIKRDRLVWVGDMHPELLTIRSAFGADSIVPDSLDFVKNETPLPGWMNGMMTYSMWFILIHYDWYMQSGDLDYLKEQREYFLGLAEQLSAGIGEDGKNCLKENRFLDWPTSGDPVISDAGVQSLHYIAAARLAEIFDWIGEAKAAGRCRQDLKRLAAYRCDYRDSKQAAAIMVYAGLLDAGEANEKLLKKGGAKGMSTFMGYYILKARAEAGDYQGCLDCVREYWGGMLSLGATTFWEDFNVEWLKNAAPIDRLTEEGEVNIHAAYGDYCYKGYRHSLCHGWASGAAPWLTEYVLGLSIVEPGCKTVRIKPHLGDLKWAEGVYPAPQGDIGISHKVMDNGSIETKVNAPEGVTVLFD